MVAAPERQNTALQAIIELQSYPWWCNFKIEKRTEEDEKPTKVPYHPRGYKASSKKSATWSSYEAVVRACRIANLFSGIGFFFSGQIYSGIDIDDCVDENGNIADWAWEIIRLLDSYTEFSTSRTGIHIIIKGLLQIKAFDQDGIEYIKGWKNNPQVGDVPKGKLELYSERRFFVVTGRHVPGTPTTINERQDQLLSILNAYFLESKSEKEREFYKNSPKLPDDYQPAEIPQNDHELWQIIFRETNGSRWERLYYGDAGDYMGADGRTDESAADAALAAKLVFYTQHDASRVERMMWQTGLARDKWKSHPTYLRKLTIDNAMLHVRGDYDPLYHKLTAPYKPHQDSSSNGHQPIVEETKKSSAFDDIRSKIDNADNDDILYDLAEVIPFMPITEQGKLISAIKGKTEKSKTFSMQHFKKIMSEAVKAKKESERESRRTYSDDTRQYFAEDGCMWINVEPTEHDEDPDPIQISNFTAEIATDILTDDGAEKKRSYEIKALLRDKQFLFEIQAEELSRGEWIDRHLGAKARITVGRQMKDHLAAAIKTCSDAPEHYYYAHTGWRKIDGRMVFLHSGGGLSQVSQVSQVEDFDLTQTFLFDKSALQATLHTYENEMSQVSQVSQVDREYRVKLDGSLSNFDLPIVEDIQKAIRSSLKFVDITNDTITMPLYAALWRAPLGRANFGVHFAGQSGLGKSELSALLQQHFGAGMHANNLPGSWESTENALEMQLFQAKDVLLVCDDFKPKGGKNDQDRLHAKADRVFRSVGNGSTRARLDSHLNQRPERRPRCLLLSTGEDVPRGESLQARVIVLVMTECITKGEASKRLSEAQKDATKGLYAQAMSGYIQWLAPRIESIQEQINTLVASERDNLINDGHARLSTNTAHLIIGMKFFLQYAIEMQAITLQDAQTYINRCIDALNKNALDTAIESKSKKPSEQWREMLIAAITSKRAHLVTADGNNPGVEYGWIKRVRDVVMADGTPTTEESFSGGGDQIGWIDGEDIYLLPQLAYKAVRAMSAATGNEITTTESSLRKFLAQDGLLASTDLDKSRKTVTVRRRLQGGQKDVLHLKKEIIFPCVTPLCEKVDSLDSLDTEASRSASEAVSDVSQVFDSNGPESSNVVDSQHEQQPAPPPRACFRCGTQDWQWDAMLEIHTCGRCNHGKKLEHNIPQR